MPGKPVVAPFNPDGITSLHKKKILESVNLIKAKRCGNIYGCIESALLWYNLYSDMLKGMGSVINTYNQCVAEKNDKWKSVHHHVVS